MQQGWLRLAGSAMVGVWAEVVEADKECLWVRTDDWVARFC